MTPDEQFILARYPAKGTSMFKVREGVYAVVCPTTRLRSAYVTIGSWAELEGPFLEAAAHNEHRGTNMDTYVPTAKRKSAIASRFTNITVNI